MTYGRRRRRGLIRFLGTVADETKDYLDDILDRAHDVNDDLRSATRRITDSDGDRYDERRRDRHDRYDRYDRGDRYDRDDDGHIAAADVQRLQRTLAALTEKVDQLAALQQSEAPRQLEKQNTTSASS